MSAEIDNNSQHSSLKTQHLAFLHVCRDKHTLCQEKPKLEHYVSFQLITDNWQLITFTCPTFIESVNYFWHVMKDAEKFYQFNLAITCQFDGSDIASTKCEISSLIKMASFDPSKMVWCHDRDSENCCSACFCVSIWVSTLDNCCIIAAFCHPNKKRIKLSIA